MCRLQLFWDVTLSWMASRYQLLEEKCALFLGLFDPEDICFTVLSNINYLFTSLNGVTSHRRLQCCNTMYNTQYLQHSSTHIKKLQCQTVCRHTNYKKWSWRLKFQTYLNMWKKFKTSQVPLSATFLVHVNWGIDGYTNTYFIQIIRFTIFTQDSQPTYIHPQLIWQNSKRECTTQQSKFLTTFPTISKI